MKRILKSNFTLHSVQLITRKCCIVWCNLTWFYLYELISFAFNFQRLWNTQDQFKNTNKTYNNGTRSFNVRKTFHVGLVYGLSTIYWNRILKSIFYWAIINKVINPYYLMDSRNSKLFWMLKVYIHNTYH